MYKVIGHKRTRTLRVLWLLEEIGAAYEQLPATPHSDDVTAHYPVGKLPVLIDGDDAFTDSVAIMTYLADKHGAMTFAAGTPARGHQDGHTHFLLDELDSCLWTASKHLKYLPEEHRVPAVVDSLKWEFDRALGRLQERLGDGPFLCGETMTIADILAAHCLSWAVGAEFPVTAPPLRDYLDRMRARPAFARALKNND